MIRKVVLIACITSSMNMHAVHPGCGDFVRKGAKTAAVAVGLVYGYVIHAVLSTTKWPVAGF